MKELALKYRTVNPEYFDFLIQWQEYVWYPMFLAIGLGVLMYALYKIKYFSLKTMKDKFDHACRKEIKQFFQIHVLFSIALFLFFNSTIVNNVAQAPMWFAIRFFIAICLGVLYGYLANLVLKYYWSGTLHKRLNRLRYTPRTNVKTGNRMKLLNEEEEDVYLDQGQQAEEDVFSMDYDVWIDEENGDTLIEKYRGHLIVIECDRCGFMTLKLEKEEVVKESSVTEDGNLLKEYRCNHCNRIKRKTVVLSHIIK